MMYEDVEASRGGRGARRRRSPLEALASALVAVAVTGCGSAEELPPPAEPAVSPELPERPAGRVVRVGAMPEGLAADPRTGLVALGCVTPIA